MNPAAVNWSQILQPDHSTLQPRFSKQTLPDVRPVQKQRADNILKKMPVIGKSNKYFGELDLGLFFKKIEELFSDEIEIAGSTVYHIGGPELAEDTASKLSLNSLPHKTVPLRDIDARVIVTKLDQYNAFIDLLSKFFPRVSKADILNDLLLATYSEADESMSFSLGDKNWLTCDVVFMFKPKRQHLFFRDAIRYSVKHNKFLSDLEMPLQGLVDYYGNVIQTDKPETINKKGWPAFIVHKARNAKIVDPQLEAILFNNVVKTKKRKELPLEIIDLLKKASSKSKIPFEDLLYEASIVLEKKLTPQDFKLIWKEAAGVVATAVSQDIPFHVIHSYQILIGKKNGLLDLVSLFSTSKKRELDQLFNESISIEERLAPRIFEHPNPRTAWSAIKSGPLATTHFDLLLEKDPCLALEAYTEFSLPCGIKLLKVLIKMGHLDEAETLYDTLSDERDPYLDELTEKLLIRNPTRSIFDRYLERKNGLSHSIADQFINHLPISDLLELSDQLIPLSRALYFERLKPYLEGLSLEKVENLTPEVKAEGRRLLVKRQIENPVQKEWHKVVEFAEDADIEPLFNAILNRLSVNQARLFCLNPYVAASPSHGFLVEQVLKRRDLSQRSLFWDLLDLSLTYNLKEAVQLIELSYGNIQGLPRSCKQKIAEKKDKLIGVSDDPFRFAECLSDMGVAASNLLNQAVSHQFNSIRLLKEGWLGTETLSYEVSCYFVEHPNFETFYALIENRLDPKTSFNECMGSLIEKKNFRFAVKIARRDTAPALLCALRGNTEYLKERLDLLKRFGSVDEWTIFLNESNKGLEEVYRYFLSNPAIDPSLIEIAINKSSSAWEAYITLPSHPFETGHKVFQALFKRGLSANSSYEVLKRLKMSAGTLDEETEQKWTGRTFIEEPYGLNRTLAVKATPNVLQTLSLKFESSAPPQSDLAQINNWMKDQKLEDQVLVTLHFDPKKAVVQTLELRPIMSLLERFFLTLVKRGNLELLKDIYIQFCNDYRNKHRITYLNLLSRHLPTLETAINELEDLSCDEKENELLIITSILETGISLIGTDFNRYRSLKEKIKNILVKHSKERTEKIPPSNMMLDNEMVFLTSPINHLVFSDPETKKIFIHEIKAKKLEAIHVCKVALILAQKMLESGCKNEHVQLLIFEQLFELVPFHNLLTSELDDAIFDFIAMVPPSTPSSKHVDYCVSLMNLMQQNNYFIHYPTSICSLKGIVDGCIFPKNAKSQAEIEAKFYLEKNFLIMIPSILKACKKLIEFDSPYSYFRAWCLFADVQPYMLKERQFESLIKFYNALFPLFPKYAFHELRDNTYCIQLVKDTVNSACPLPNKNEDLIHQIYPPYIDALIILVKSCPKSVRNRLISDIMSNILKYSMGRTTQVFSKFIDYVEHMLDSFENAEADTVETFSNGVSATLSGYTKEKLSLDQLERLTKCFYKLRIALRAFNHLRILNMIMMQWSETEQTLDILFEKQV